MKIGFKDWRECSQKIIPLELDPNRFYYLHAKAWHLKGYLGGTHSWSTFFSRQHNSWLVAELTERETLGYQPGDIVFGGHIDNDITKHAPYITTRPNTAQWFGGNPVIVDSCLSPGYQEIEDACREYPLTEFRLLDQNCNTFTSYLIWKLGISLHRPFRSFGFRNKDWWQSRYGT